MAAFIADTLAGRMVQAGLILLLGCVVVWLIREAFEV